ncbi:retention module-containing protein [Billgrantia tianxiuensis]|uniref:Retention module-containing protein n=7 Tax=Halomonadaceae TaxID=28256 RepID=A0A6I6SPD3_9GAMM|nr:retention module-containing protein [Halomonas tianxiuensis]QHC50324.1 retention module-containing protein [Halomonas tianxiuensis]
MAIATVISITGQAWARDAEGNLRELRVGDTLLEGETLITSDTGSAQLDFGDGLNPTLVEGDEQVVMTSEIDGDEPTDASEFAALDQDIEALLAALDDDSIDLLDILDATAAGAGPGGAADGGHGFVRLARIAEDVNPLAFEYGLGLASELPEIEGGAFLAGEEEAEAPAEIEPLPPGTITVSIQDFNSQNVTQVFLVGTTTNVPAGSIVTLVITDQAGNTVTTTATVDAEGNYQTEVDLSELVDGPISVEARVVDQIGETRTAEDDAVKDTFAEATITIDTIAGDDVINGEEAQGPVTITGSVGGDAREGDTVTLTVGGQEFTGTVTSDLTYAIDVPGELLAQHDNVEANVSGSDEAGNPYSADSDRDYGVNLSAEASITIDVIAGDDVINGEEARGPVTITGSVGGDAREGDTVTLTVGGQEFTGAVETNDQGELVYAIDVPGELLAQHDNVEANVSGSDEAGNPYSADSERDYGVNLEASATITIDVIAGDDVINGEEAQGPVTITGSVGGDAREGDTVTLTVGGQEFTGAVETNDQGELVYAIDVPGELLAQHDNVEANVSGSDEAGNPYSADSDRDYGVNLEASATITIDVIAGDDVINGEEATQLITITGSVGGDAREGDTVTLTVGGQEFTGAVETNDQGELVYAIDVPGELLAQHDNVEANVSGSDEAGNPYSADSERDYGVNLSAEALITIDTIAGDDVINGEEAQGPVTITGSVGGDAREGDTVTLTVGGQEFTGTVTSDLTYAIDVPGELLAQHDNVEANVSGSDEAGNPYSADSERDYGVNLSAEASITIDVIAGDDVINGEEATQLITITGSVGGDAREGDTVTLTVGGQEFTGLVGEDLTYAIDVPGELLAQHDNVEANVSGSDEAGNPYSADSERDYGVNLSAEASITIDVIAGDDVINGEEATQLITITGSVGGDAREGDTVTLTVGGQEFTGTVTSDLTYAIDVPGELLAQHDNVEANVSGSDEAGNPYSADSERDYGVNLSAEASITIDTIAGDDVINGEEAQGPVTITGSVGGDAREGDTVTLTVGGQEFTGLVGEDLTYAIDVPGELLAQHDNVEANVSGSDEAGNPYSADSERDYGVNLSAEASITIDVIAGDDVINGEEAQGPVTITGSVGGDAREGDTVTLTVGGQEFTGAVETNDQGELVYAIDVPGELLAQHDNVEANVSGSDEAGNPYSADSDRDYGVNLEASATITIDVIAGDDVINGEEATQLITITGSVGGDAREGDTVTLTVGGQEFTGLVGEDLTYAIDVPGELLAQHDNVEANVSGSDEAGNPYSADSERDYGVNLSAEASITIDTIAGDDVINGEEAQGPVTITGSVGGDAREGDTVTLTVGGQEFTGTVTSDLTYAIDVPGELLAQHDNVEANVSGSDEAGNPYSADSERDYGVNLSAEASITIDVIAGDDVINGEEATQLITITGSVGGDAREGDTVTLTVGGQEFTGTVTSDLTYAIDVPGELLAQHDNVEANVSGSDEAGNPYSADSERDYGVNLSAEASITIDVIAGDDVINGEEATQLITITGSVGGDAREGDTVTLTVGGQEFTGTVTSDLTYAIDVPGELLAQHDNVEANVSGSDEAGNPYSADSERDYGVNLSAEASITIDTIAGDDVINGEEAQGPVTITGSVGGDAREGDTVTLTVGGQEFTGLVGEDLTYAIDVPGELLAQHDNVEANVSGSDEAGNPYSADSERDYGVAAPEITGLNSGGADIVVDEQHLQNGSNPNPGELIKTGTFGINAVAGIAYITVAGQEITIEELIGLDGTAAIEIATPGGNVIRITGYQGDVNSGVVMYEFELTAPVEHIEGGGRNEFDKDGLELSVADQREQVSSSEIDITIVDDVPSDFTPETGSLEDGFVGSIGFETKAGADGVGNVVFTVEAGTPATDINGLQLFLDGEPLYYSYDDNDQSVLLAKTAGGELGFKIVLDSGSDTYTITTYGKVLNGTEFSATATSGVSGGNSSVYGLNLGDDIDNNDVLVSTRAGETVNTSTGNGIGISNGSSISKGEVARFDFVAGLSLGSGGASWDESLNVTRFAQEVSVRGGGGNTATLTIKALSSVSATGIPANGGIEGNGDYLPLTVEDIRIYDENGADVTSSLTITQNGNGIQISGIKSGYAYELSTSSPFQAIEVVGGEGSNFNLGDFTYFQGGTATDIELGLPVQG